MKNKPSGFEGIEEKLLENLTFIINDYILLANNFYCFEQGGTSGSGITVKTLHKHNPYKYPDVLKLLFKGKSEEYPEELLSELEKLITELRNLSYEVRKYDDIKKGKVLNFTQNGIEAKQKEIGFVLPNNFKDIFLKALQIDKVEYIPNDVVDSANKALLKIMRM
nr:hypothetical protein [Candidatus Gracilibacteria bacterium]